MKNIYPYHKSQTLLKNYLLQENQAKNIKYLIFIEEERRNIEKREDFFSSYWGEVAARDQLTMI